jgi:hypothetical protein
VADLRGQSDSEVVKRLIAIADSRFQDGLVREAKATASCPPAGEVPERYRHNLPRRWTANCTRGAEAGLLPDFPFGTDLTADELHIVRALKKLKHATQHPVELVTMAVRSLWEAPARKRRKDLFVRRLFAGLPGAPGPGRGPSFKDGLFIAQAVRRAICSQQRRPFGIGALPGLWSRGHRNPQGAAVRPGTSDLWLTEHGPQGGDEVNRVLAGRNYGWPLVSYGCPYGSPVGDACRVGGGTHAPTYEEPKSIWVPTSIAPGGIAFYTGAGFPEWQGHLFVTALAGQTLWRLVVDANDNVTLREEVAAAKALNRRIRHVRQGPDGWLYLLTDDGRIVRLAR